MKNSRLNDAIIWQVAQANKALQCEHALLLIEQFLRQNRRTDCEDLSKAVELIRLKLGDIERDAWRHIGWMSGISDRAKDIVNANLKKWFEDETSNIMSLLSAWNSYPETDEKAFRQEVLNLFGQEKGQ